MKAEHEANNFKKILKDKMEERLSGVGYRDISSADPTSRGKAFLEFYLYEIFAPMNDIEEDDIEECIVDGPNDLGIDFIHIHIGDKKVLILQSKYGPQSINDANLQLLKNLPTNLNNPEYVKNANKELRSIIQDIDKIHAPNYHLVFLTNQKVTEAKLKEKIDTIKFGNDMNCEYEIKTLSQIRKEYNRVQSLEDELPAEIVFSLGNEDFAELNNLDSEYNTVLITQKGTKIKELYREHHDSLFNYNIRLGLGANKVNEGMKDTIKKEPGRFFYYNNGISAVCENYQIIENELVCKNLQIINGAQTVTTLAEEEDNEYLSNVKVLIRIVEGERGKKVQSSDGLNENIVKFNNSQTTINTADFRSNDPVQIFMEGHSRKMKYTLRLPFKKIFYKRKRRKNNPKKHSKIISPSDIGKAYYAFKFDPHKLSANNLLWDIGNSGLYYAVFGENGVDVDVLDENKTNELFGSFYIFEYIKTKLKLLDKEEKPPSARFKYHVLWALGKLLKMKYDEDNIVKLLRAISKEGHYINKDVDSEKEEVFSQYCNKAIRVLDKTIKSAQKSAQNKGQIFVLRNAQRDKLFTDELKGNISVFISPEELQDLEIDGN